jgi:hypothetical protein
MPGRTDGQTAVSGREAYATGPPPSRRALPAQPRRCRLVEPPAWLGRHALTAATGLAASTPVIASTIKALRAGWMPAGDDGIIATRAWDVLTSHSPLVGQYSEASRVLGHSVHSPGPMLYWLIALPARFGGVWSIAVTMSALSTLAIVGCVALARRRGGAALMFGAALAIALMCQSLPAEALHDIWNPSAALFPFLLLIFTCWSIACGDERLLPLAVLLASFVTHTHLVYALPVALLMAGALAVLLARLVRRRRHRHAPAGRRWPWALGAVLVALACWAPPAIDQLDGSPGNLTLLVRAAEQRGPTLGAGVGWHAVERSIGARPWWLYVPASPWQRKREVRADSGTLRSASTIALLAALVLVALGGARRRRVDVAAAALIGLGLCAAIGLQAASNPSGRTLAATLGYTLWWGSEVGLWVWLTLFWAAWLAMFGVLRKRRRRGSPRARRAATYWRLEGVTRVRASRLAWPLAWTGGLVLVLAAGIAVAASGRPDSHVYQYRAINVLGEALERATRPGETLAYHPGPLDPGTQPIEPTLRFLLVRHGVRPLTDGALPRLGSYYFEDDRAVSGVVFVADGFRAPHGMRLLARVRFSSPWRREVLSVWTRAASSSAPATPPSRRHADVLAPPRRRQPQDSARL